MFLAKYRPAIFLMGFVLVFGFIYVYYRYDPGLYAWFPKCPFRSLTGLQCPGCGSQRAIHALLHGQVIAAFQQNALVPLAIPYLAIGFYMRAVQQPGRRLLRWRKILYGGWAIKIFAILVLLQFILRNLPTGVHIHG